MEMSAASVTVDEQWSVERRRKHGRSRVSNGRDLLPGIDGRSPTARRYRDITAAILVDQGGEDRCSESRKHLIRRFAAAAVLAERLEAKLVSGADIDIQEHATLSSTLVRLAQRIGIDRVPRDVGSMTLADYLDDHGVVEDVAVVEEAAEVAVDDSDAPATPAAAAKAQPTMAMDSAPHVDGIDAETLARLAKGEAV
jgi:hypothetical protein